VLWNLGTRAYVVTTVAGVEGCGRRATYVLTGYERGGTGAWLMNTGPATPSSGASSAELAASSRAPAQ